MNRAALCVGINQYLNFPAAELRGCRYDAAGMAAFYQIELGFVSGSVSLLMDRKAERDRIVDHLSALADKAKTGMLTYIGYSHSSHGTQLIDVNKNELDGYDEALVFHDSAQKDGDWVRESLVTDDDLRAIFKGVPPECRIECFFDTCFGGGMRELALAGLSYGRAKMIPHPMGLGRVPDHRLLGFAPHDGAVFWGACQEHQTSADAYIEGRWCGAFTHFFTKNYRPWGSRKEILSLVRKDLRTNNFSQTPQITCGRVGLDALKVGK